MPLVYRKDGKERERGYEYTAMIENGTATPGLAPGIFFNYDFTPYGVVVNERSHSYPRFFTSVAGVLAGEYAALMLFDLFLDKMRYGRR
jgi:hypothetical protein